MPDGVRLAARRWLPEGEAKGPVPAIFEFIPYRKADMVRARDEEPSLFRGPWLCLPAGRHARLGRQRRVHAGHVFR